MTVECIECIENDARMNDKTMMCPWKENHRPTRAGANCMHCTMVDRAHKLCEFIQYLSRLNLMRARKARPFCLACAARPRARSTATARVRTRARST